jgi:hypothetical protein
MFVAGGITGAGTVNIDFGSLAIIGSCGASVRSARTETAEFHREPQSHQPGLHSHGPSSVLRGPNNWTIIVYKGVRRQPPGAKSKSSEEVADSTTALNRTCWVNVRDFHFCARAASSEEPGYSAGRLSSGSAR